MVLLNLTGLSLGYAWLARWVRFALYLVVTAALVVAAFATDAADRPWLWRAVFGCLLLWMAFDGWWLARRHPGSATAPRTVPGLVAAAVVVVMGVGYVLYGSAGHRALTDGQAAMARGDCVPAVTSFDRVTGPFELTLSADVAAATAGRTECSALLRATGAHAAGDFAAAIKAYRDVLWHYPDTTLRAVVDHELQRSFLAHAAELRSDEKYSEAATTYRELLATYPDGDSTEWARSKLGETYLDEAASYLEDIDPANGQQASALIQLAAEQYFRVVKELPETLAATSVPKAMSDMFDQALRPFNAGQYCVALPSLAYFSTVATAPGLPATVFDVTAEALYGCGVEEYGKARFDLAAAQFDLVIRGHPTHARVPAAQAALIAAEIADSEPDAIPPLPGPLGGDSPGANPVTFYNTSRDPIEVLVAGVTAHRFVVPGCTSCPADYPSGQAACATLDGKPSHTLNLAPGAYQAGTRAAGDDGPVSPNNVRVEAGFRHTSCVYRGTA